MGKGDLKVGPLIAPEAGRSQQLSRNKGWPAIPSDTLGFQENNPFSFSDVESLSADAEGSIWLLWSLEDAGTKPSCGEGCPNLTGYEPVPASFFLPTWPLQAIPQTVQGGMARLCSRVQCQHSSTKWGKCPGPLRLVQVRLDGQDHSLFSRE